MVTRGLPGHGRPFRVAVRQTGGALFLFSPFFQPGASHRGGGDFRSQVNQVAAIGSDLTAGGETLDWLTAAASCAAYSPLPFPASTVTEARRKVSALKHELARRH